MVALIKRLVASLVGASLGGFAVAAVEARSALRSVPGESLSRLFLADAGVLAPLALGMGVAFSLAHAVVEPGEVQGPWSRLRSARREPVMTRTHTAALAPLLIVGGFVALVALANVGRGVLGAGTPKESGALLGLSSLLIAFSGAALVAGSFLPLRRVLAAGYSRRPWLLDPVMTGGLALGLSCSAFVLGIRGGDTGGDGAWPLGVFGVLKRDELDLRPVLALATLAVCAYVGTLAFARRSVRLTLPLSAILVALSVASTSHAAISLNTAPNVARGLERGAPLGRMSLALLRRVTDKDRDGASDLFGGGDCDDCDSLRSPFLIDEPGNGLDEDCSGADTPKPPAPVVVEAKKTFELPADLNVVLITIDTLRPDVGFMGYGKPTTPNLDALAAKGTVFDHAYSLASYTGKSIGPMMIGKYPSETDRDSGHFNTYFMGDPNVAERLRAAKVRTFGAASHWYFQPWSGLSRGMDDWDMSAQPRGGQGDNDTSVTSMQLSDVALRLLAKPENSKGRFFMWLHYFDPHEQYMPHEGAPDFRVDGEVATRAQYDGEVWFTDRHIGRVLDYIRGQPFAEKTAIIVTSDHGEAFAEHNMSWHGVELWESLIHVPLVVYVPGQEPRHVAPKRSHIDLVPTILELMHVSASAMEGRSLVTDALGDAAPEERDVLVDMPAGPYTMMHKALIVGPTPGKKLIWFGGKNYQLFDLANDPGELHDLSGEPEQLTPMLTAFERTRGNLKEIEAKPTTP